MSPSQPGHAAGPEVHAMSHQRSFPSGAAEWRCTTCGRWTVMTLPSGDQRLKIIVLEAGNEQVIHHASAEGVTPGAAGAVAREADPAASPVGPDGPQTLH